MALNYVNCLPNQPVYKPQFSPNPRTADVLSPNRRWGREAAQFPPTNIATVELVTVVTSFLTTGCLKNARLRLEAYNSSREAAIGTFLDSLGSQLSFEPKKSRILSMDL